MNTDVNNKTPIRPNNAGCITLGWIGVIFLGLLINWENKLYGNPYDAISGYLLLFSGYI